MCQPLSYAKFRRWVENDDFDISAIAQDSLADYVLEIDLEYLKRLYDEHVDLPFCSTRDKPPDKQQDKLLTTMTKNVTLYIIATCSSICVTVFM